MNDLADAGDGLESALRLLRDLRRIDMTAGVRNSRIAFDVAILFFEAMARHGYAELSVDRISAVTGHSGPTVRLVLKRLLAATVIQPGERQGKAQFYGMTAEGFRGFDAYVTTILAFRAS